jgi:hypothetical protein
MKKTGSKKSRDTVPLKWRWIKTVGLLWMVRRDVARDGEQENKKNSTFTAVSNNKNVRLTKHYIVSTHSWTG